MKFADIFKASTYLEKPIVAEIEKVEPQPEVKKEGPVPMEKPSPEAFYYQNGTSGRLFEISYNGEKNMGAIGPPVDYWIDYVQLRSRSWKAYLDSEIAQTILRKFNLWVIGSGLKLQAEPSTIVLKAEGITLDLKSFTEITEARFGIYCEATETDYSGMKNFHQLLSKVQLMALIGGDVLVIHRYENGVMTTQLVDGCHIETPFNLSAYRDGYYISDQGNRVIHGVELDDRNQHVAYHIRQPDLSYMRVPARSETSGLVTAYLVYGLEYRLDDVRGIPLLSATMQTIAQVDAYKQATLGAAREAAKLVYTVEHANFSDGTDPLAGELRRARGAYQDDIPRDELGRRIATKVAATTNNMTFNMPVGASMKSFNSQKELYYKDFFTVNAYSVCATVGIPPNVAFSQYDSSYSSSRAAIKEWEHTINVNRVDMKYQFLSKGYAYWLDIEILSNKIQAPGYINARLTRNLSVLYAYRKARFVGAAVPHIDPVKEVQAARLKLGPLGANIPLTTAEKETEALNSGDSDSNLQRFAEELKQATALGLDLLPQAPAMPPSQ